MPDPISPRSLRLLQAYFDARCDIFIFAHKEKLPVLDLIRWSQSPAVQSHIAALKKLTDDSIHLRTAQARLLSLDTLEKIVKTTDDPHELRRAASVIYRGGATMPQPRPPRAKPPDPDKPPPRYILAKDRDWCSRGPGHHPAYIPPRPTAHDSFCVPRVGDPRRGAGPCPKPRIRRAGSPVPPRTPRRIPPLPSPPASPPPPARSRNGTSALRDVPSEHRPRDIENTSPIPREPSRPP